MLPPLSPTLGPPKNVARRGICPVLCDHGDDAARVAVLFVWRQGYLARGLALGGIKQVPAEPWLAEA